MKIGCNRWLAILVLLGLWIPSNATEPGYLHAEGRIYMGLNGAIKAFYELDFRLPESSGGVLPTAEVMEIEFQGNLNPDGSVGSAFIIAIPMEGFTKAPYRWTYRDGVVVPLTRDEDLLAFNPAGLRVSQFHDSFVWDFLAADATPDEELGVKQVFVYFRPPEGQKVGQISVRLIMRDNRPESVEPKPILTSLLAGTPALRMGQYEWKSQIQMVRFGSKREWCWFGGFSCKQ